MRALVTALLLPLDRLLGRLLGGGFGVKDLFTVINLLGGVVSMGLAVLGELWWASFAIMIGFVGDVLDGPVARITGRHNRFGHELDTIADHTSQCVAPAVVVFLYYKDLHVLLAFGLAAALVVAGSIRHARGAAAHFDFDLAWHGMPRPVAAFLVLSFLNSNLCHSVSAGRFIGIGLVLLVAVLNLAPLPFMSHHGRPLQRWVKSTVIFFFLSAAAVAVLLPHWFWDLALLYIFAYSVASWAPMTRAERRAFFAASRRFRAALAEEGRPAAPPERPPAEAPPGAPTAAAPKPGAVPTESGKGP